MEDVSWGVLLCVFVLGLGVVAFESMYRSLCEICIWLWKFSRFKPRVLGLWTMCLCLVLFVF